MPRASANRHEYVHPVLGEEIRAIGGGYSTAKIETFAIGGRDLLYTIVVARVDSSCCGEGGCLYANVIGYVIDTRAGEAPGAKTSLVEPIADGAGREELSRAIRAREQVHEVRFWSPEG